MTHKFKPFMVFILCCSNSSRASPLKDNTRSRIVLIKKLTDAIQLSLTLKTTTAQVFRNVFRKVRHDVYFETFEVHMKTTYHPAKATKSKHQKLWAQCMLALLYHWNVQERSIYDNCCFHIESFRASRLITKVSTHE